MNRGDDLSRPALREDMIALLRCPVTGARLVAADPDLATHDGSRRYARSAKGIPLFAAEACSAETRKQQAHYEAIASAYVANLSYPHTEEYVAYLDETLLAAMEGGSFATVAEICCGTGEGFALLGGRAGRGVGIDISPSMLAEAVRRHPGGRIAFAQGDATALPLADAAFDSVIMLGGIHHVNDRRGLFREISRILKPGGTFYFREPVSDFILWRVIRNIIYRLSPILDHETERPLLYEETVPLLKDAGLECRTWRTCGFVGFCLFMNSDVLMFNRLFRFLPGIRGVTRFFARLDDWVLRRRGLRRAGLLVIGVAGKPLG